AGAGAASDSGAAAGRRAGVRVVYDGAAAVRLGELRSLFPELETLEYREGLAESERGTKAVAGLVARK
ncbi:MAG: hypothetical protein ACE1ZN_02630, partial [Dehalococcoidia bacterium]